MTMSTSTRRMVVTNNRKINTWLSVTGRFSLKRSVDFAIATCGVDQRPRKWRIELGS